MATKEELLRKVKNRQATVAVVGLGYVGLPLAVEMARREINVIGIDVAADRVTQLESGSSYIQDVPDTMFAEAKNHFRATTNFDALAEADIINICVPTPLVKTKDPDISYIISVCNELQSRLRKGQLVILESTTYPGTTDEIVLPFLKNSGLKIGEECFLAFSPERVDPGNEKYNICNTPKVVGGITAACTEIATAFYNTFIEKPIPVSSTRVAEMVKLLENTFRMVNIGLVNELSVVCNRLGIDTWETIDAAATKPFGFLPFYPGPGLGGHCIPVDPYYLSWKLKTLDYNVQFIELAGKINFTMPHYIIERVTDGLNEHGKSVKGARILLLGVAYKENIDDVRESPALDIIDLLMAKGADVSFHDPYVKNVQIGNEKYQSQELSDKLLANSDCVIITTKHSGIDYNNVVNQAKMVIDTRNATKDINDSKIFKL